MRDENNNDAFKSLVLPRLVKSYNRNCSVFFREKYKVKRDAYFVRSAYEDGVFCCMDIGFGNAPVSFDLLDGIGACKFALNEYVGFSIDTKVNSAEFDIFGYVEFCKRSGFLNNKLSCIAKIDNERSSKDLGRMYVVSKKDNIKDEKLSDFISRGKIFYDYYKSVSVLDWKNSIWNTPIDLGDYLIFCVQCYASLFDIVSSKYRSKYQARELVC